MSAPDKKFLIVSEGPTDYIFMKGLIENVAQSMGKHYQVDLIAPQIDATMGSYEAHGWTGVKRWCQLYCQNKPDGAPEAVKRKNWQALIAMSEADMLLIQLDTDIANEVDSKFDESQCTRRECCESNINMWLGVDVEHPNCKYVLPTYQLESWLLATYDVADDDGFPVKLLDDYETIIDVEDKLIQLGYASKVHRHKTRLKKNPGLYKDNSNYLNRLIDGLEVATKRCSELERFRTIIEAV